MAFIDCLVAKGLRGRAILLLQQRVAESEFDTEASRRLAQLKNAVPQQSFGSRAVLGGWMAVEAGHDSNINRATSEAVIQIPLLNYRSLKLPELLVERRSGFTGLQAGAVVDVPLDSVWRVGAHGQGTLRANFSETSYLPHNYHFSARLNRRSGSVNVGVVASTVQQWVAKYRMLDRLAAALQVALLARPGVDLQFHGEYARNTYPQFQGVATSEKSVGVRLGLGVPGLVFGAFVGQERSATDIKDLDRRFDGLSLAWHYVMTPKLRLKLDLAWGRSHYDQFSRLFATRRNDTQIDLSAAASYRIAESWMLTPRIVLERADSSVALNGYRRTQALVELRKEF